MIPLPARSRQVGALYRSVARLVSAGIPPLQCAALLRETPAGVHARPVASALAEAFSTGGLPSTALQASGAVPPMHVSVVASGEATGRLDKVFDILGGWCEEQARLSALSIRMLLAPAAAWLVIALLLPLGRLIRSGLGAYAAWALPVLLGPPLIALVLSRNHARTSSLPFFSEVFRLLAVSRFCRTLAMLNAAGLTLPKSLRDASAAAAHPVVTPAGQRAAQAVERGMTMGEALRRMGVLRPVEMSLVIDGELTGRIDTAFQRAAELLEHEAFTRARWRLRVVGAILFAIVAVFTAFKLAGAVASTLPAVEG